MKKEEKTEITKAKIMKAAIEEFGMKGYRAASLNSLCSTGISKGLLYHNFENKDAIYLACVKQCFMQLNDYLLNEEIGTSLHLYMDKRLHFFHENPYLTRIFFESILQPPVHLIEEITQCQDDFQTLNQKLFKEMLTSITLRDTVSSDDAMEYFLFMQTMFNTHFSRFNQDEKPLSEVMKEHETSLARLLDFMLYGIAERNGGI